MHSFRSFTLDYKTPVDAALQSRVEAIDARLREKYGMTAEQSAVGLLDLRHLRLAMVHPDREDYAASVPKIIILLAYFHTHSEAATRLDAQTRQELGLMIKVSSNEMAAKYSRALGLKTLQQVIEDYGFYDRTRGGGLWCGKHYGQGGERYGDPLLDHSHAATVRQLLRYYLLLEQEKLVSPAASRVMREIFASPPIPHEQNKFLKGLASRPLEVIRKSGSWEDWMHDTAVVTGKNRHYIVVAMTRHPRGDDFLADFAAAADDLMTSP